MCENKFAVFAEFLADTAHIGLPRTHSRPRDARTPSVHCVCLDGSSRISVTAHGSCPSGARRAREGS